MLSSLYSLLSSRQELSREYKELSIRKQRADHRKIKS
jgi:hypothetical protein